MAGKFPRTFENSIEKKKMCLAVTVLKRLDVRRPRWILSRHRWHERERPKIKTSNIYKPGCRVHWKLSELSEAWKWSFEWMLPRWSRYSPVKESTRQYQRQKWKQTPDRYITHIFLTLALAFSTLCKYSNGSANGPSLQRRAWVLHQSGTNTARTKRDIHLPLTHPMLQLLGPENYELTESLLAFFLFFLHHHLLLRLLLPPSPPPHLLWLTLFLVVSPVAPFFHTGRSLHRWLPLWRAGAQNRQSKSVGSQFLLSLNYTVTARSLRVLEHDALFGYCFIQPRCRGTVSLDFEQLE